MDARRRISFVVLETFKAQATCDPTDFLAYSFQPVTGHFVLQIVLMFAASRKMNVDITAAECFLQEISQIPISVVRRPVHLTAIEEPDGVDLERESVGERDISTGIAAAMSVTPLVRERL